MAIGKKLAACSLVNLVNDSFFYLFALFVYVRNGGDTCFISVFINSPVWFVVNADELVLVVQKYGEQRWVETFARNATHGVYRFFWC